MRQHLYILFILSLKYFLAVAVEDADYCSISCSGVKHTLCEYQEGGGSSCTDYRRGLTDDERGLILTQHNQLRQTVARGQESRGPQPAASNMMELKWDTELETIAQRWADQCLQQGHDQCRSTLDGTSVGQNIGSGESQGYAVDRSANITSIVLNWYNEVSSFSPSEVDSFDFYGTSDTGHYTEMVWAVTTSLGCGMIDLTSSENRYSFKLVCNYKPEGNVGGSPLYLRGTACSACPTGTSCSATWPGLCT